MDAAEALGGNDVGSFGPDLANREFGVPLLAAPRGRVSLGNVSWGEPQFLPDGRQNPNASSVVINETGVTPFNFQGYVHSHPGGNLVPTPAGPDGNGDVAVFSYFRNQVIAAGLRAEGLTMYLVSFDSASGQASIMAYDWDEALGNIGPGREVNPEARPCTE